MHFGNGADTPASPPLPASDPSIAKSCASTFRVRRRRSVGPTSNAGATSCINCCARKVAVLSSPHLRSEPALSNRRPCKALRNSSSTGGGATVTRRRDASFGPCFSFPKKKPRRCLRPIESRARCCCEKSPRTTFPTQDPKYMASSPSDNESHERPHHAARQPLRPLPGSIAIAR